MTMVLSYLQAHLEELAQAGLHVISAMPNWIVTAAPLLYSDGGPAASSRPAPKLDLAATGNTPVGWHISFDDSELPFDPNCAKDGVVAVLDSSHHPDRCISGATLPEFRRNC